MLGPGRRRPHFPSACNEVSQSAIVQKRCGLDLDRAGRQRLGQHRAVHARVVPADNVTR